MRLHNLYFTLLIFGLLILASCSEAAALWHGRGRAGTMVGRAAMTGQQLYRDNEHEGRGGWTAAQINANIDAWLKSVGDVDIVLFSSPGGNDALNGADFSGIVENINAIIDKIQAHNPNITIIIEQLAPGKSSFMTDEYTLLFAQMKTVIAQIASIQTTTTSMVIAADMATGFTDDLLADDIHYNKAGAEFIAARYYNKLVPLLN